MSKKQKRLGVIIKGEGAQEKKEKLQRLRHHYPIEKCEEYTGDGTKKKRGKKRKVVVFVAEVQKTGGEKKR